MTDKMSRSFLFETCSSVLGIGHFQFVPRSVMYTSIHSCGPARRLVLENCAFPRTGIFLLECTHA